MKECMVQGFLSKVCRLNKDLEILQNLMLPGKVIEGDRTQRSFDVEFLLGKSFGSGIQMFVHNRTKITKREPDGARSPGLYQPLEVLSSYSRQ